MASESLESSLAPTDFPICASFEDTTGAISVAVERCQLCGSTKRNFYCKDCVRKGETVHSRAKNSERYADKIQRWNALKRTRSKLIYKCDEKVNDHLQLVHKKASVTECARRVSLVKQAIVEAQQKFTADKQALKELRQSTNQKKMKAEIHNEKKSKIRKRMKKVEEYMNGQQEKGDTCQSELAHIRTQHIDHLIHFIFPIEEVQPKVESNVMELSTVSALAEARHTAYIRGRWVYTDNSGELQYRVVDPCLPGNGDYSPYNMWLQENKAALSGPDYEHFQRNPAYTISAALCYTSQLTSLLAYFLSVNLPHRLCYSDFCKGEMSEQEFNKAVYKLNHNVLHLCFSQHVVPEQLQPRHTIHNVLTLIRTNQLGRHGNFLVDSALMQSFEESHQQECAALEIESSDDDDDYLLHDHDDTDAGGAQGGGGGGVDPDWEQVPTSIPEVDLPTAESYFVSTQSDSSLPSALMASAAASVASFWKAYTGTPSK